MSRQTWREPWAIERAERQTYEEMWALESYAQNSPGERYAEVFTKVAEETAGRRGSVLDAGCGSGKGSLALARAGFQVMACDLTPDGRVPEMAGVIPFQEACLWHDLSSLAYMARAWYGIDMSSGKVGAENMKFDHVYCTDVLEHLPTAFTMLVVARALQVVRYGVFVTVSTQPDRFGVWVGKHLHQTVQPFTWWRDALSEVGQLTEARDLGPNALFYVRHPSGQRAG